MVYVMAIISADPSVYIKYKSQFNQGNHHLTATPHTIER